jgi:hypothetical protein
MRMGKATAFWAAIALALTLGVTACGSDGGGSTSLSRPTADRLAAVSDEIASDLDSGDTCGAAHRADDLKTAVQAADLPDNVRTQVESAASQLVEEVNCEPQATTTEKQPKPDEHGHGDEHKPPKPPKQEGDSHLPPGQAKKLKEGV